MREGRSVKQTKDVLMSMWLPESFRNAFHLANITTARGDLAMLHKQARTLAGSHFWEVTGKTHNTPYSVYLSGSQLKSKQASQRSKGKADRGHL